MIRMNFSGTVVPFSQRLTAIAAALLSASLTGCVGDGNDESPQAAAGSFYGVEGLSYDSGRGYRATPADGTLAYDPGVAIRFSIGGLDLGTAQGAKRITVADLVPEVAGNVKLITNRRVTNLARFMQSLDDDAKIENGIRITPTVASAVGGYAGKINFDQSEAAFTADSNVVALFSALGKTLVDGAQARNPLRRTLLGIRKETDVQVPMRDGTKLYANVWRPIDDGQYPVIVNAGAYGKDWSGFENQGCICNSADLKLKAVEEDDYFEGKPAAGAPPNYPNNHEHHETLNTVDWVPKGYVKVVLDDRGRCNNPGNFEQFSYQEAKDYYDAVEWAAVQPYANGNAGVWGVSYWSIAALQMAQFQPPHLKAIIPLFTDIDTNRQVLFNGGLWNAFNFIAGKSCLASATQKEWPTIAQANPFYSDALYGPTGSLTIASDMSKINIPMFTAMPLEHPGIHTKGSSEAFIGAATTNKKFAIVQGDLFGWPYQPDVVAEHIAFMDHWLKGKTDNGAMSGPPVRIKIRTGGGNFDWQYENEWPIARTEYRKLYLDARASSTYPSDGLRSDIKQMPAAAPTVDASVSWAADIPSAGAACWNNGVSFVTEPLAADITVAGYLKLVTSVSSTSRDMDLNVSVRVIDPTGKAITLAIPSFFANDQYPLGYGWLQVGKRKIDAAKSTVYRPTYTMLQSDYAPLVPNQPVPVEVELWPTTGKIVRGSRLRLDVQPVDGCGAPGTAFQPGMHLFDASYKNGQTNALYTGPSHPSYLQIPVIPAK